MTDGPDPTRRGLLGSVGATLAAGVLAGCARSDPAASVVPSSRSSAQKAAARLSTSGSFVSKRRRGARCGYTIARPGGAAKELPVVVVLHGRGADHTNAFGGHIELNVALLEGGYRLAVAAVDGGDTYWHRRASGEDSGAMVTQEFLPRLRAHGLDTERIGLLGRSMGGFGVLSLAAQLGSGRVAAVVAESPAIWPTSGQTADGAFDDPADFARHDVYTHTLALRGIAVRVDCGTDDGFYPDARDYAARLQPHPAGGFTPGGHDEGYWRRMGPEQLKFLAGHLS